MKSCGRWTMMAMLGLLAAGCERSSSLGSGPPPGDSGSSGGSGNTIELEQVLIDTGDYEHSMAALHENGESVWFGSPSPEVTPTSLTYQSNPTAPEVQLVMDPSGRPDYVYVDGYFALFGNWSNGDSRVDVALIAPDGTVDVVRDFDIDLPPPPGYQAVDAFAVARWAGHTLGAAFCVIGLASAASLVTIPVTLVGCTSTLFGILAEFDVNIGPLMPQASANLSGALGVTHCGMAVGNPGEWYSCLSFIAVQASNFAEFVVQEVQENSGPIANGEGALESGHGDFQATLTWDTTADLDLWVTDPFGETIIFYNPDSASGGHLDVDDTNGYGPENIFWPPGAAPEGDYLVQVDHYSGASPTGYMTLVQVAGASFPFSGTIYDNQLVTIGTFTLSNYPSMSGGSEPPIVVSDRGLRPAK